MKSRWIPTGLFSGLALVILAGCGQEAAGPGEVTQATEIIPSDAAMVFTIANPESLYHHLHLGKILPQTGATDGDWGALLDLDSLRTMGLDPLEPVTIAVLDLEPAVFAIVMEGDGPKLGNSLSTMLAREGRPLSLLGTQQGVEIRGDDGGTMAFFTFERFLVMGASSDPDSVEAISVALELLQMNPSQSLGRSKEYRDTMAELPPDGDVLFYARLDPRAQLEDARARMEAEGDIDPQVFALLDKLYVIAEDVGGTAGSLRFVPNGLVMDGYSQIQSGSDLLAFATPPPGSGTFHQRVPGQPRFMYGVNFGAQATWAWLRPNVFDEVDGAAEWLANAEQSLRQEVGIELEADLIRQFSGEMMLLVDQLAMVGSDIVLYLRVDRPGDFQVTLEKLLAYAGEQSDPGRFQFHADAVGGVPFHKITMAPFAEVCCGLVDDYLVITSTRARFAGIVEGDRSFADALAYDRLAEALDQHPSSVVYLDLELVGQLLGLFGGFIPAQQQGGPQMAQFLLQSLQLEHCFGASFPEKDGMRSTFRIESGRSDFWAAVADFSAGAQQ